MKALASSTKAALRMAESGVMSIQFLIPIPDMSKMAFVEFYVRILDFFKVTIMPHRIKIKFLKFKFCPDQEVD